MIEVRRETNIRLDLSFFFFFFGVANWDVVNVVEDLIARWRIPLNLYVSWAHCARVRRQCTPRRASLS